MTRILRYTHYFICHSPLGINKIYTYTVEGRSSTASRLASRRAPHPHPPRSTCSATARGVSGRCRQRPTTCTRAATAAAPSPAATAAVAATAAASPPSAAHATQSPGAAAAPPAAEADTGSWRRQSPTTGSWSWGPAGEARSHLWPKAFVHHGGKFARFRNSHSLFLKKISACTAEALRTGTEKREKCGDTLYCCMRVYFRLFVVYNTIRDAVVNLLQSTCISGSHVTRRPRAKRRFHSKQVASFPLHNFSQEGGLACRVTKASERVLTTGCIRLDPLRASWNARLFGGPRFTEPWIIGKIF